MSNKFLTVKTEGRFSDLERMLDELVAATSVRTARTVLGKALIEAIRPMANLAAVRAPKLSGRLARSFAVIVSTARAAGNAAYAKALRGGASKGEAVQALRDAQRGQPAGVEVIMGPGRHPKAHMMEFGTFKDAAQPYMRPAWEAEKLRTLDRVADFMRAHIAKALARAVARAAKIAARIRA